MTREEAINTIQELMKACVPNSNYYIVGDMAIKALEQEPTNTIDYRRAFKIACDLLNGDILYGVDTDKIYELMMKKDEVVSSSSYEEYILNHLQDLDQGQYANEPTTKNDLGVDCVARQDVERFIEGFINEYTPEEELEFINLELNGLKHLHSVTPQEPRCRECKWWKDSDGAFRRGIGAESQCPINTHAVYSGEGYCYKFSPKADMREVEE